MLQHARFSIASLALGVSLVLARPSLAQTQYTVIDLGGLPGAHSSQPFDINDRGEAAGVSGFPSTGVAWTRDGIVELGTLAPFGNDSIALGINKRTEVVGHSAFFDTGSRRHGFLWRAGVLTDLGTLPGETDSYAASINNRGEIAGTSFSPFGRSHVVLWRDGVIHDLGVLPDGDALVTDINNRRQIVGYASSLAGYRAFTWRDGVFTYLPTLSDAVYSLAWSINDRGDIVGSSLGTDGRQHAVLWRDGTVIDLGSLPGSLFADARGINDRGQVVGYASFPDVSNRAFVWEDGVMTDLGTLPAATYAVATSINNHNEVVGFGTAAGGLGLKAIKWIPVKGGGK